MTDKDLSIREAVVTIKIIGVGGGGGSVLARIARERPMGVELIAINTDEKQLAVMERSGVKTLQIGRNLTKGRGTGGVPSLGEQAAQEDAEHIKSVMLGADLIFVTAALGGGAGTGAAPIVAKIAKDLGVLTIGVVTLPFSFEGQRKRRQAEAGLSGMQAHMDALLSIRNDNLMKLPENRHMSLMDAFKAADDILLQAIRCIAELILTTGVINVDFADVKSIFQQSISADALLGIGKSTKSAVEAVRNAVESPLIEKSLDGARGLIINLSGDETLSLYDVNEATRYIYDNTDPEVNIILGTVIDPELKGTIRATIIATDFVDGSILKMPRLTSPTTKLQGRSSSLDTLGFMRGKNKNEVPVFRTQAASLTTFRKPQGEDGDKKKE